MAYLRRLFRAALDHQGWGFAGYSDPPFGRLNTRSGRRASRHWRKRLFLGQRHIFLGTYCVLRYVTSNQEVLDRRVTSVFVTHFIAELIITMIFAQLFIFEYPRFLFFERRPSSQNVSDHVGVRGHV